MKNVASLLGRVTGILLLWITLPACVFALDPAKSLYQFNCQSWTRQNGLTADRITTITQTNDGTIWLGTQNGLVFFDGLEFKPVSINLPQALNQEVRQLCRAANGGLWFANNQGGFGFYDGKKTFSPIPDARWSKPQISATTIFEGRDGSIWTGMQPGWGRWFPGNVAESQLDNPIYESTLSFCEDSSGRIWRGTAERGLYFWTNGKWSEFQDPYFKKRNIFSLVTDNKGQLFVGTELGVRCYGEDFKLKESPALSGDVKALLLDSHGVLWVGTNGAGLARYRDGVFTYLKKADGLVSDYITSLFEDSEGSLWIGTRDGLSQLTDLKFPIYTAKDGISEGPSHSVSLSRNGGVWISSLGLCWFNGNTVRAYLQEATSINQYVIMTLESTKGLLYLIDGDKNIAILNGDKLVAKYSSQIWPRGLVEDKESVLVGIGDTLFRIADGTLNPYLFPGEKPPLHWINNLSIGSDASIWVSSNNGVFRFKDGQYKQWSTEEGLSGSKVNWTSEDIDGSIWVGMPTGMARIKNDRIVNITGQNGLYDSRIYAIIPDDLGHFWVSCGHGIFRVSRKNLNDFADGKVARVNCDVFDGMESVKFTDRTDEEPSGCKTPDGRIWFPNSQGVLVIDPAHFFKNLVPPKVFVQQVRVDGIDLDTQKSAKLKAGEHSIEFDFAALSYISPKRMQVQYQLKGLDLTWIDAGERRFVIYNHLKPGRYDFQVQACNADGLWNTIGDTFSIELLPHYYETAVFRVFCALAGTLIVLGAYRLKLRHMEGREKKLKAENDLLEQKVTARTAELAREHALLCALLENSSDQIFFKDAKSRYLKASKAQAEALGVKEPDELIGKSDFDFFSEEHTRPSFEEEKEIMRTGRPIIGKIEKESSRDGRVSWIITSKMPLRNNANEVVGTFGTSKSITAIKEAQAELEQVHKELLEKSRQAGMAEVATNVLHNVGNVLNSVNVSAALVIERLRKSKLASLTKVAALLQGHEGDLALFFLQDPRGKRLPAYMQTLAEAVAAEQSGVVEELQWLCKNVEHIKEIVGTQQAYAKVSGVTEMLSVAELVEDALRMHAASRVRNDITWIKEYGAPPLITTEKHKVLQILVNLFNNAKDACDRTGKSEKTVTLRIEAAGGRIKILFRDNGIGISPEQLTRIFAHGFTTRKEGHGFGLHSGALAAKELGGSLVAHSDGIGKGTTFILELPVELANKSVNPKESGVSQVS